MVITSSRRQLISVLLLAGPLVALIITPWASYDPINIPKFATLVAVAAIALALLLLDYRLLLDSRFRAAAVILAIFNIDLLIVFFCSSSPFTQQFFGTSGRNTGYLAYLALSIIFFAVVVSFDAINARKLAWTLYGVGVLSALYGLLQSFGGDPFAWNNPYSPVFGFLGNPDFQSSFLGICGAVALALLLSTKNSLLTRGGLGGYLVLALYVIGKTKAQQGFLVLAVGSALVLYIYILKSSKLKKFSVPYLALGLASGVLVVLGTLNKGPLAHLLYKLSVTYRGDYWRAAWKMTLNHPFSGVGLDSYGDWYRASRTVTATVRRGPDVVSNAAHNVFLDFSSNGGFPLLIAYLLIVGLVLISAVRVIRRNTSFDPVHAGLFGAWVAYQIQSLISLNQLGLAIWGWILSGALVAYEIATREVVKSASVAGGRGKTKKNHNVVKQSASPAAIVSIFIGLLLGLALGLPSFLADAKFRSFLSSGDASTLPHTVTTWPIDDVRLMQAAEILEKNKLEVQALTLAKLAVKRDPRSYFAWQVISVNSKSTSAKKSEALAQMKVLDPHNPGLK